MRGFENIACVRNITHSFVFLATSSLLIRISVFETHFHAYTRKLTSEKHTHTRKYWCVSGFQTNVCVQKKTHWLVFLATARLFIRMSVFQNTFYAYITKLACQKHTTSRKMWCVGGFRNNACVKKSTHMVLNPATSRFFTPVSVFETNSYA